MILTRKNNYDLLEDVFNNSFFKESESKVMKTDIYENEDDYTIIIDLPGCCKEDIKIEVSNGYLIISSCMDKQEDDKKYIRRERFLGQCSRSFYVGEEIEIDNIKANYNSGLLKISVPKREEPEEIIERKYIEIED